MGRKQPTHLNICTNNCFKCVAIAEEYDFLKLGDGGCTVCPVKLLALPTSKIRLSHAKKDKL